MAQIEQMQIKFDPVEDRLLMRVSGGDNLEFRFWLTRRFVKLMWPALSHALKQSPLVQTQLSPLARKEMLAFEHQKAVSDSDFRTPYRETPKTCPLGDEPVLLAKMQTRRNADGSFTLALGPQSGAGIDLALNNGLLHSLAELIRNGAALAHWELPTPIDDASEATAPDKATVN